MSPGFGGLLLSVSEEEMLCAKLMHDAYDGNACSRAGEECAGEDAQLNSLILEIDGLKTAVARERCERIAAFERWTFDNGANLHRHVLLLQSATALEAQMSKWECMEDLIGRIDFLESELKHAALTPRATSVPDSHRIDSLWSAHVRDAPLAKSVSDSPFVLQDKLRSCGARLANDRPRRSLLDGNVSECHAQLQALEVQVADMAAASQCACIAFRDDIEGLWRLMEERTSCDRLGNSVDRCRLDLEATVAAAQVNEDEGHNSEDGKVDGGVLHGAHPPTAHVIASATPSQVGCTGTLVQGGLAELPKASDSLPHPEKQEV